MADQVAPVTVTLPSGKTATVHAHRDNRPACGRAVSTLTEAGLHRLNDGKLEAVAAAGSADAKEAADVIATGAEAGARRRGDRRRHRLARGRHAARSSRSAAGRQMAGAGWLGFKANGAYRVTAVTEIPLFATLLSLGALLLAVCAMWYREGR